MPHPSVAEDSPRYALWVVRSTVRRKGHRLGPAHEGVASCTLCGAAMVDDDAYEWWKGRDREALGSFSEQCPGIPQFDAGSRHGSATTRATHYALMFSDGDGSSAGAYVCDGHADKIRRRCEASQNPDLTWSVNRTGFCEKMCEVCDPSARYPNLMRKARSRW